MVLGVCDTGCQHYECYCLAANFEDGNKLWSSCGSNNPSESGFCRGYVAGIADALDSEKQGAMGFRVCIRNGVTVPQVSDLVKLWLQNHPQSRDFEAAGIVAAALQEAFPCSP